MPSLMRETLRPPRRLADRPVARLPTPPPTARSSTPTPPLRTADRGSARGRQPLACEFGRARDHRKVTISPAFFFRRRYPMLRARRRCPIEQGFTTVELVVVIVVAGILAA